MQETSRFHTSRTAASKQASKQAMTAELAAACQAGRTEANDVDARTKSRHTALRDGSCASDTGLPAYGIRNQDLEMFKRRIIDDKSRLCTRLSFGSSRLPASQNSPLLERAVHFEQQKHVEAALHTTHYFPFPMIYHWASDENSCHAVITHPKPVRGKEMSSQYKQSITTTTTLPSSHQVIEQNISRL
ncbi:uncharacterized protein MYCFIDRAFT_175415 [Pseudocercospora fijiensis CIRAD86]|uniref:Uncharacterized protein n=1 Tax=Pseudocercospora fijiensis (strain CIRAD86) TaxID=383855 RepID=M3AB73_PSEFD|nr:uncharacterized protein MYCFIDRAFT_175415 [Pseudocercospora fijiensis CIRAD86]EME81826.1 hypothetical protein MYCFIDRAFT_175415 [Pseudocercospora fijiensis CIRAD86]